MSTKTPIKNALSKVGKALAKIGLPAIGTAIGGPAGGILASTVGELLGIDPDKADSTAIEAALAKASPEAILRLRELEAQVSQAQEETKRAEEQTKQIDLNTTQLVHAVDMASQSWLSQNIRPIVTLTLLAFFILFITGASISLFLQVHAKGVADPNLVGFIFNIATLLGGVLGSTVAFYFGGRAWENVRRGKPREQILEKLAPLVR